MRPIFLIGFMGCGKSTLGRNVSKTTGIPFIDLDTYIERRFHHSVKQIFAESGETGFRDLERRMLHEVADFEDVIVACGGGTPCFFDNIDHMNTHGTTVYLVSSEDRLFTRLKAGKHKRPLLANLNDDELSSYISAKLAERLPFYSKAQHKFNSDKLDTTSQVAETVALFINQIFPFSQIERQ